MTNIVKVSKMEGNISGIKYLSSLLYYLYNDDIITEEFWMNFAIKKSIKYNSLLYNPEVEKKFLTAAAEFTKWIETGPYEGDEEKKEHKKGKKKKRKKRKKRKRKKKKRKLILIIFK